jgi:hypothetical protein
MLSPTEALRRYDVVHYDDASFDIQRRAAKAVSRAKLHEADDPLAVLVRRLTAALGDHEAAAKRHMEAEADYAGKAAARANRGETELAAQFEIRRHAAERCAQRHTERAAIIARRIASIKRRQAYAADVVASLQAAQ